MNNDEFLPYQLGHYEIDKQHRILFMLFRKTRYDVLNKNEIEITTILLDLIKYAIGHFDYEEELMEKSNYDLYEEHAVQHLIFKNKILTMLQKEKNEKVANDLLDFLKTWLEQHILQEDKKLIHHINKM